MLRIKSSLVFASLILGIGSVTVQADEMNWGDFAGSNVIFRDVTESTDEAGLLFEQPTVENNSLVFLPPNFRSSTVDGATQTIEGLLTFTLEATGNNTFNSISVLEFGSFFDVGATSTSEIVMDASVVTADGLFEQSFSFTNVGDNSDDWQGELQILFPSTESAVFTLNNILMTNSDSDGAAFIGKKGISIKVAGIPEPTAVGMLALAGLGLLSRRRRPNK